MQERKVYDSSKEEMLGITGSIDAAIELAKKHNEEIYFIFNDTKITIYPQSYNIDIMTKWALQRTLDHHKITELF